MPDFASLLFTDCRTGEGLLDAAGLQFRAVSVGVDHAAMEVVESQCLYEPPDEWMRRRRPVSDYPRSLAHVYNGRYATASGRYLGTEAKGSRQGNHFTHAVVTDDPDSYGQVRPAQLWDSPMWLSGWTGATTCPPVDDHLAPAVFEPPWLQRWVADQPDGEAALVAVMSGLVTARAGGERVLFVATDPHPVLAWIAAATILMPRADALRVGFKVFVANPDYSAHDAVAVHPLWGEAYRGAPGGTGFSVFDLESGTRSAVPPVDAARYWVPRFLRGDCFDVLDAVELSGALRTAEPAEPGGDRVERVLAGTLVLGEPVPPEDVDAVLAWIGPAPGRLGERHLLEVVRTLLRGRLGSGQLDALRRIAADVAPTAVGPRIGRWIFTRELSDVGGRAVPEPADRAASTRAVEAALRGAAPETVRDVLALAARYDLQPDPAHFVDALHGLVRWCADGGSLPELEDWTSRHAVTDLLRDELGRRVRTASAAEAAAIGDRWWPQLWTTIQDPRAPLDATLAIAARRAGSEPVREAVQSTVFAALRAEPGPDAVDLAWRVLHPDRPPTLDAMTAMLALAPARQALPPGVTERIETVLASAPRPDRDVLAVLDRLVELGGRPSLGPLPEWHRRAREVDSFAEWLASWAGHEDALGEDTVDDALDAIDGFDPQVLAGRMDTLLDALGGLRPHLAADLVAELEGPAWSVVVEGLMAAVAAGPRDRILAISFLVAVRFDVEAAELGHLLVAHRRTLTPERSAQVADLLFDDDERTAWAELGTPRSTPWRPRNPFRRRPR